ncbi:DUF7507 domain-containing protein [Microbacterium sp. A588]
MMKLLRRSATTRRARGLVSVLASLAVVASALVTPAAAMAVPVVPSAVPGGPAIVSATVDYVSGLDFTTPITELQATYGTTAPTDKFALNIGYSCGAVAACEDVTIRIDPQQLDRTYGQFRFATYASSTLPTGATIGGNNADGYTVSLGTIAAGTTGSFTVAYTWQNRGLTAAPQSFFVDGEQITSTVTIDATNAGATHAASDAITWHIQTLEPQVTFASQGLARADTDYDYVLRMGSDCMWYRTTANHGEPSKLCAESYTNTFHLPEGSVFVATSPDGIYDAVARTVTWTQSGQAAADGWGSANGFSAARTVTVQFPSSLFADGCMMTAEATFDTDVTYLDGQNKQASTAVTHDITDCTPFGAATPVEKWSTLQQNPNIVWDDGSRYSWYIRAGNKGNTAGVAVITDENLDEIENIRVYQIFAENGRIDYALDDGTAGTAQGTYNVPAGREVASVTITSPTLAGPNKEQASQPLSTLWTAALRYETVGEAPAAGWERSNTASAVMTYPGSALADVSEGSATSTVIITPRPANFTASIAATLTGTGNPVAGVPVDYRVNGVTSSMESEAAIEPQYLFIAPYQWNIVEDSWSIAAGAPAGASFTTKTVTYGGQQRQALYVHWPEGTKWGMNARWPDLLVQAAPSASAAAGSVGVAHGVVGDATNSYPGYSSTWGGGNNPQRYLDVTDIDGDDVTSEYFAAGAASVTVGASSMLSTIKEICRVNTDAVDGCDWVADTSPAVAVSPVSTDITYRVTLRNNGTTPLSNIVAYDVLPYPSDTGISSGSAATARGSQFSESVAAVSAVSPNLALTYSSSTDPCRSEVYAGGPAGCDDDWGTTAADAASIRAAVTSPLAPGASASFVYTANVLGDPSAGERACNSIATAALNVPVSEPSPVCVVIEAADLEVTATAPVDVQLDRPAVLPFTVSNLSGTDASSRVTVSVPAGIEITGLEFGDWTCTTEGVTAPVDGPATLECVLPGPIADGESVSMDIPVIVRTNGVTLTVAASSSMFDPVPGNNSDAITILAQPAAAGGLTTSKDDGLAALVPGQETTYTITVTNELIGEDVSDLQIVDTLPADVEFVSASDEGTHADGTVTWNVAALAAAGSVTVTVTVRVPADTTATSLSNTVTAQAPDPAFPDATLTGTGSDVDQIDRIALTKSATLREPGDPLDPQPGDVIDYELLIANTGSGPLSGIVLDDPKSGLSELTFPDGWPSLPGRLGAGESVTAIASYTLTSEDIDNGTVANTATVTALSGGGEQATATSSADLALPAEAGIVLSKDAMLDVSGTVLAGDQVAYAFQVENTGNVTLNDVAIDDALEGLSVIEYDWPAAAGVLRSGESVIAEAIYVVTQEDIDRGTVSNTAIASGLDAAGVEFTATDAVDVIIPAAASISFSKTGDLDGNNDRPVAGDTATFTFVIENTGNVTQSAIAIADHLDGVSDIVFEDWPVEAGMLAPGQAITGTASYSLSQADVDAGEVVNTATFTSTPVRGLAQEAEATALIELTAVPELAIVKTAELLDRNGDGLANPGEQIRYGFELENTGNVTLIDVTVDDAKVTGIPMTGSLAPGQKVQVSSEPYTVTESDAAAGHVENTATSSATAPDGNQVTSDSSTAVTSAGVVEPPVVEPPVVEPPVVEPPVVEPPVEKPAAELPSSNSPSGGLAATGAESDPQPVILAGGLLGAGLLLLALALVRRRRKAMETSE